MATGLDHDDINDGGHWASGGHRAGGGHRADTVADGSSHGQNNRRQNLILISYEFQGRGNSKNLLKY